MTVVFLYGAGAEALIFVTGTSGKRLSPGRKIKVSGVYHLNKNLSRLKEILEAINSA